MTTEPILDEIRRVRHAISQRIGHDPTRIVSYYADLQRQHRERLVNLSGHPAGIGQPNRCHESEAPGVSLNDVKQDAIHITRAMNEVIDEVGTEIDEFTREAARRVLRRVEG